MSRRWNKKDKKADALAGFIIVIAGLIMLSTGSIVSTLNFIYVVAGIIFAIGLLLFMIHRNKLLTSGIADIDKMSGKKFEQLLLEYFLKLGYRGKLTDEYADYGADLLLVKDNTKYVVQAKRWNQKVSVKAIQEIVASIKYYNADRGIVITNSYFTGNAESLARSNNIILWDRKKLIDIMSQVQRQDVAEKPSVSDGINLVDYTCPRCGNKLILRSGSHGKFYGCKGFPKCRYTQNFC